MSSICIRYFYIMGPFQDRYIHYDKSGDQFVGRTDIGISSLLKIFYASPAYFELKYELENLERDI